MTRVRDLGNAALDAAKAAAEAFKQSRGAQKRAAGATHAAWANMPDSPISARHPGATPPPTGAARPPRLAHFPPRAVPFDPGIRSTGDAPDGSRARGTGPGAGTLRWLSGSAATIIAMAFAPKWLKFGIGMMQVRRAAHAAHDTRSRTRSPHEPSGRGFDRLAQWDRKFAQFMDTFLKGFPHPAPPFPEAAAWPADMRGVPPQASAQPAPPLTLGTETTVDAVLAHLLDHQVDLGTFSADLSAILRAVAQGKFTGSHVAVLQEKYGIKVQAQSPEDILPFTVLAQQVLNSIQQLQAEPARVLSLDTQTTADDILVHLLDRKADLRQVHDDLSDFLFQAKQGELTKTDLAGLQKKYGLTMKTGSAEELSHLAATAGAVLRSIEEMQG